MISARNLASSLYGVWLILRWETAGFDYFDRTFGGFWRSYIVAAALAPIYAAHTIASYSPDTVTMPLSVYIATEVIAYVMSWTVFPFAMITVARTLERDDRLFQYLVPYNWFQLAVGLVSLPITVLTDLRFLAPESAAGLNLVVLAVFFSYGIFLARHALKIGIITAVGIVFFDVLLSLLVRQVVTLAS